MGSSTVRDLISVGGVCCELRDCQSFLGLGDTCDNICELLRRQCSLCIPLDRVVPLPVVPPL